MRQSVPKLNFINDGISLIDFFFFFSFFSFNYSIFLVSEINPASGAAMTICPRDEQTHFRPPRMYVGRPVQ